MLSLCALRSLTVAAVVGLAALSVSAPAGAIMFDQNVTPDVIFGSGNANGSWTTEINNNVEVGLRAKVRFNDLGAPENTFNSNGAGTYKHKAGQFANNGRARWSFEWAVNVNQDGTGSGVLDQFVYQLRIDTDPSAATNFVSFDPINQTFADHSIGTNATGNGLGTEANNPTEYATLIANNNVAQQSWQTNFFPAFFPAGYSHGSAGRYEFEFSVLDPTGPAGPIVLASTAMTVLVPEPGTLLLFSIGLIGLGLLSRRRLGAWRGAPAAT